MNNQKDIAVLEKLTDILDKLKIAYVIGGSMASSAYGAVRFTQDADITVEPFEPIYDKFIEAVESDFYVSKQALQQALQNRSSFNIISFETAFKIDIFIRTESEFQKQLFSHSRKLRLGAREKKLIFASPEDIILLKLDWYRKSDYTSQRQWTDVLGVLAMQKERVDFEYLNNWAATLKLNELLQKAIKDSKN